MGEKSSEVKSAGIVPSKLERVLEFSSTISASIAQWAVVAMMLIIVVGVTFRYVLKLPLQFDAEYVGYLLVIICLVGAAYALKAGSHVRVDIFTRSLPPRLHAWMQVTTDIMSLFCVVLLLYFTARLAYLNWIRGVVAVTPMETPLGPIQTLVPLGFTLFLMQLLAEFSKSLRSATKKKGA